MNLLIYIIPAAFILIIFMSGFIIARKKAAAYNAAAAQTDGMSTVSPAEEAEHKDRVYEVAGKNQSSAHPLGAVQSVIRGRIRFIPFGIMLIGIALMGGVSYLHRQTGRI